MQTNEAEGTRAEGVASPVAKDTGDAVGVVSRSLENSDGRAGESVDGQTENHEMEVDFQHEADLPARYLNCQKNPGHAKFIPVVEFGMTHLPEGYQEPALVELIQEQAKLAVRLKVKGNSPHRPTMVPGTTDVPYPFSGPQYRKILRMGSGWIQYIVPHRERDMTECPCNPCQQSGQPRKVWTKVIVATAAHVVYDMIEARKCTCQLFYDTDSTDLSSCPELTQVVEMTAVSHADNCTISYIIHDQDLTDKLNINLEHCKTLSRQVRDQFKPRGADDANVDLSQKLTHLYQRCTRLCEIYDKHRNKVKEILGGDPYQQWQIYSAGRENALENPDFIGISLMDNILGGHAKMAEKTLANMDEIYDQSCMLVGAVKKLKDSCGLVKDGMGEWAKLIDRHRASFLDLVRVLERQMPAWAGATGQVVIEELLTEPVYDSAHPLTIIVSHPHGCSKKVTVGKVIEMASPAGLINASYQYDNATCPGSSGARVYVLGRAGAFMDHAHSGSLSTSLATGVQVNESVVHQDV